MKRDKSLGNDKTGLGDPFSFSDICNINRIYNENYEYFLQKKTLEKLISGKALDHPYEYSEQEQENLQEDIRDIYRKTISEHCTDKSNTKPLAIITAGASGAGKTSLLRQNLEKNKSQENVYIYVCADETCLKNQMRTYQKDIQDSDLSLNSRQKIFNKWRPSSHGIKHLILGNLIRDKKSFCLGTSCTEPGTEQFFKLLKKQGYQIQLLYVTAPDEIRWNSIQERNKTFIHGYSHTLEGIKKHAELLAEQVCSFPDFADEIAFYYRKSVHESAQLTALWTRNTPRSETLGSLQIFSPSEYTEIKKIHNEAIKRIQRPDLNWENYFDKQSKVFQNPECRDRAKL
ncbi:MAG: zeta toxin family protein [Rhabdochlamydiaceae bacterium]|nr:zeta toxin family protein [Rhabdochlamydiaceae bacterium]